MLNIKQDRGKLKNRATRLITAITELFHLKSMHKRTQAVRHQLKIEKINLKNLKNISRIEDYPHNSHLNYFGSTHTIQLRRLIIQSIRILQTLN